jgi:hypothetical protein
MLGLDSVPPAILRKIDGRSGSLQVWIENSMTEKTRLRTGTKVMDEARLLPQLQVMMVFDNLIYNSDRHGGNILYDRHWNVWMTITRGRFTPLTDSSPGGDHQLRGHLWSALRS